MTRTVGLEITDKALLLRFGAEGDESAFDALVRRWDRRVLAHLVKACGDYEAAQDMRQEVFLRVYRYAGTYNPQFAFTTWFFRIVANVLSTWRKKQALRPGHRPLEQAENRPDGAAGPRERAAISELGRKISGALAQFEPDERQLLLFRLKEEMSYPEIAAIVGAPETTVKSRVYVLVSRLRAAIEDQQLRQGSQSR